MTNKIIDSKHNSIYKYLKKIATKKVFRKEQNKTILIGPPCYQIIFRWKKEIEYF